MNMLFDHNVPRRLRRYLTNHQVTTTQQMLWDELRDGLLVRAAAEEGFDLLLTLDKDMEYEQNPSRLPLPIVLMGMVRTSLTELIPHVPTLLTLLGQPLVPAFYVVQVDGTTLCLTSPRPKP